MNIIDVAIEKLGSYGWTQGDYEQDATGACCILGALPGGRVPLRGMTIRAVECIEDEISSRGYRSLEGAGVTAIEWNDEPGRTLDEVLDVLRSASARFDGRAL